MKLAFALKAWSASYDGEVAHIVSLVGPWCGGIGGAQAILKIILQLLKQRKRGKRMTPWARRGLNFDGTPIERPPEGAEEK
jgi:hypothetical protein